MISLRSVGGWIGDLLFRNWGTKAAAFALTLVLFISTRDEVTRTFEIPIRIERDPERVLLTEVPRSVQIQVRGPWTRLNRLQPYDFGNATIDLRSADPGPLTIDRASIVMPSGVVLSDMQYDQVDLRFEPVVEQSVPIVPNTRGRPAKGFEVVRVEAHPEEWHVRGGRSRVNSVQQLATAPVDVEDATQDVVATVALQYPRSGVLLVGVDEAPQVRVRVVIEPAIERRAFEVAAAPAPTPAVDLPNSFEVFIEGPATALETLEKAEIGEPVVARARLQPTKGADGEASILVEFEWAQAVPRRLREELAISPRSLRVTQPERQATRRTRAAAGTR